MTRSLDVLVLESQRDAAGAAVHALESAGHRVHRCHPVGEPAFPCVGLTDASACPIDKGVDVALLVRRHVHPRPRPLEAGVTCVIRAGLPLVEQGPPALDPFEPWLSARVSNGDVVGTCEMAAPRFFDPLRRQLAAKTEALLAAAGVERGALTYEIDRRWGNLEIRIEGPQVSGELQQALAVRVLDAVRACGWTFGQVDVSYNVGPTS